MHIYKAGAEANSGPVIAVNRIPNGLTVTGWRIINTGGGGNCTGVETPELICEVDEVPDNGQPARPATIKISVKVAPEPPTASGLMDDVVVSGGGAAGEWSSTVPVRFGSASVGLGFSNFDAWFTNANGTTDLQAGSHPYETTVAFAFNTVIEEGEERPAGGDPRNIDIELPPGLVGDPDAVGKCTRAEFEASEFGGVCPASSVVGEDIANAAGQIVPATIYNMVPPRGVAAQFAFDVENVRTYLNARVRSGGDYGITVHTENVLQDEVVADSATFWGVPPGGGESAPFLTLPSSCNTLLSFGASIHGTWENENAEAEGSFQTHDAEGAPSTIEPDSISGCDKLVHFEPEIAISPETTESDTPTGLTADLKIPQDVNPEELATSGLQDTTVTLPAGMAINPGQATGLAACQPSEEDIGGEGEEFDGPPSCPAASKVGTDEITTPLLPDKLEGSVYVLQSNPPELKLLLAASGDGVNIKLPGTVQLNETTGQLTTTFDNTPDFPVTEFKLSFSGGAQAALVTPPTCAIYQTSAVFTPWSGLENALDEGKFAIDSGPDGTPCRNPLPFAPTMTAGSTTDQAGGYTHFSMLLQRGDGQQRVAGLQFKAPKGLSGMIAKIPLCPEPQADLGTCSEASEIGHAVVGAGPGPYPLFIPQAGEPPARIYLTGPYEGAPFGLSIAAPVIAGPFNLGMKVVRGTIAVDPHTAQITVTINSSGPYSIPTILDGVPTDIRSIDAVIEKPGFMFNPTNCAPMSFTGTATSTEGATAPMETHFQVGSCQALKFKPDFKVTTSAKTSRQNGASLTAKIVYPTGELGENQATSQANIQKVKVELPKRLPSRLTTLQKACVAAVFDANPANCSPASVVGHATAITPILPVPVTGPVYFVSHGDEAFPSLIAVLQGYGVTIDLVGTTFISKHGITSSTFKEVPDVPVSSFELTLPEGPYSALTANGNLCKGTLKMPTEFTGQNNATLDQTTKITVTGCPKTKKAKGKTASHKKQRHAKKH